MPTIVYFQLLKLHSIINLPQHFSQNLSNGKNHKHNLWPTLLWVGRWLELFFGYDQWKNLWHYRFIAWIIFSVNFRDIANLGKAPIVYQLIDAVFIWNSFHDTLFFMNEKIIFVKSNRKNILLWFLTAMHETAAGILHCSQQVRSISMQVSHIEYILL